MRLRLGTRGSRLALTQTNQTAELLRRAHPGLEVEVVILQTTGDKIQDSPLSRIGGKGVFTKEIEEALLDRRIDVAVHSLKDVPTRQPDGLALGAILKRVDPHDLLMAREPMSLNSMPSGTSLGTSSLRRRAQARRVNPSIQVQELRGNVPTRIRKMVDGSYEAVILAAAGVGRLGESAPFMEPIPFDIMLPAPAQGAVGLQIREDDEAARDLLASIHDDVTASCCEAERSLLEALGGGCQLPLGAFAEPKDGKLHLRGRVVSLDGAECAEGEAFGKIEEPVALGKELASILLERGAQQILDDLDTGPEDGFEEAVKRAQAMDQLPLGGKLVLVTRDEDTDGPLSMALRELGAMPLCLPLVTHAPPEDPRPLEDAIKRIGEFDWLLLTSRRAIDAIVPLLDPQECPCRVACVGLPTADAARKAGFSPELAPNEGTGEALAQALIEAGVNGSRILYPRSDLVKPSTKNKLQSEGAMVEDPIAYRTVKLRARAALEDAMQDRKPDAALFCSASAVEALEEDMVPLFENVAVGSIGPRTTEALNRAAIKVSFEADDRSFPGLAKALVAHLDSR